MRILVILLAFALATFASADLVGLWQGVATLGPSNAAQGMDGDNLLRLQISKAFLKTLNYTFDFKADKTFVSSAAGEDIKRRLGKGTWSNSGNMVTLLFSEENGIKRHQTLLGTLTPDGKKMVISINSKPGLPPTKLVFKKIEAAPLKKAAIPAKPASGKSTGH